MSESRRFLNSLYLRAGIPHPTSYIFHEHLKRPEQPTIPSGELHISGPVHAFFDHVIVQPGDTISISIPPQHLSDGVINLLDTPEAHFNLRSKFAHGLMDADRQIIRNDGTLLLQLRNHHPVTTYIFDGQVDMGRIIAPGQELSGEELVELGESIDNHEYIDDEGRPRLLKIPVDHIYVQDMDPPKILDVNTIPSPRDRDNLHRTFGITATPIEQAENRVSHTALQIYGTKKVVLPPGKSLLIVGGVNGSFYDQHTSAALFETANWTLDAEIYKNDARPTTHLAFAGYNLKVFD